MSESARALLVIAVGIVFVRVRKAIARHDLDQRRRRPRNWGRVIPDEYTKPTERFVLFFGLVWIVAGVLWLLRSL